MPNLKHLVNSIPLAPIKICALPGCEQLAEEVNRHLIDFRQSILEIDPSKASLYGYAEESFLIECECPRFGTGESKGIIKESVRGVIFFLW